MSNVSDGAFYVSFALMALGLFNFASALLSFEWLRSTRFYDSLIGRQNRISRASIMSSGLLLFCIGAKMANSRVRLVPDEPLGILLFVSLIAAIVIALKTNVVRSGKLTNAQVVAMKKKAAEDHSIYRSIVRWMWMIGIVLLPVIPFFTTKNRAAFILALPLSYAAGFSLCDFISQSIWGRFFNPPGRGDIEGRVWTDFLLMVVLLIFTGCFIVAILSASTYVRHTFSLRR